MDKLDQILRKAVELCKEEKILERNRIIDGFYVSFGFWKMKPKCKECGRVLE